MLILVAVSVRIAIGDNGILNSTISANKSYYIAKKREEVEIAVLAELADKKGDKTQVQISDVVAHIKNGYSSQAEKNAIIGESTGEVEDKFPGTITYNPPASGIKDVIVITIDADLNVTAGLEEPDEYSSAPKVTPPGSTNIEVGDYYYNAPDLTGFDPASTYYVTYDSNGQHETIAGRIDRITPEGNLVGEGDYNVWHDYGGKVWANVVTVKGSDVTYWVWVPRYEYKGTAANNLSIKFVDTNDVYYTKVNGEKTPTDLEEGYALPDSFKFGEKTELQDNRVNLAGFWASKYEVQDTNEEAVYVTTRNGVKTVKTTKTYDTQSTDTYTIFVEGTLYDSGVTLPYTMTGLKKSKNYDICVYNETQKKMVGRTTSHTNNIQVDTSGFDPESTYYITYDERGQNETIAGRMDKISEPENWYDYDRKIWANLVTVRGNDVTYWTYIPRYEYVASANGQSAVIQFISKTTTTPTGDYWKIPDSFTFGANNPLAGIWSSKYEVQDSILSGLEQISYSVSGTNVAITTTIPDGTYTIYKDGELLETGVTLTSSAETTYVVDVGSSTEYDIMVYSEKNKRIAGSTT